MKLLFADETDRQEGAQGRKFFCICGLSIDGSDLIKVCNDLEVIKEKYGLLNFKDSRKNNLPEVTKIALTKEIFECLSKYKAEIRGIITGSFSLSYTMAEHDIYMGAMTFLLERFTLCLVDKEDTGSVTFDSTNKNLEKEFGKKFYQYVRGESLTMRSKHIAFFRDYVSPAILFADDNHSILIQAVDLIATSLNSAIANSGSTKSPIDVATLPSKNKFLEIYWPLFMRSPTGKVEGWGVKIWY